MTQNTQNVYTVSFEKRKVILKCINPLKTIGIDFPYILVHPHQ